MTLQSNATNFASYTHGSVDVRTGLYGFTLEVPPLNANFLQGPKLPVDLTFNPLNTFNAGYGIGWDFKFSRYDLSTHRLSLYTGESFAVSDQGPGQPAVIHEQKFKAFTFEHIGSHDAPRFLVTHTHHLREILEPLRADDSIFLPTRVETLAGLGIDLRYDDLGRLLSITDDFDQSLLTLEFEGNSQVQLHVHPGTEAHQQFTLKFDGEELRSLMMPASDQLDWTFHYDRMAGMPFLQRLTRPFGGEERIRYKERGHQYPGIDEYLPHVIEHLEIPDPLDEAHAIRTTYQYSGENFLGNGASGLVWDKESNRDQLYRFVGNSYNYHTTVSHYLDGKVSKTVRHTFNRFHLMTEQVTDEAGCILTVSTEYHDKAGSFESQDVRVQLPKKMTKTWTQRDTQLHRKEWVETDYDTDGNLVRETLANGMIMLREFYPASGAKGCPPDPDGFKRNLKSLTVYPAEGEPAKVLRTRYTYRSLPRLATAQAPRQADSWLATDGWLVVDSVQELEVVDGGEKLLRREDITHLNMPANAFLHGRIDFKTTELGKTWSRTEWRHQQSNDDNGKPTRVRTTTTFKPHGGTLERTISSLHSALRDQPVETQDTNGVQTRYGYDIVNRPSIETVAPGDTDTASRTYRYGRATENQRTLWYAETTDVNKVVTRTYHDGLNRPVREERTLVALDDPQSSTRITRKVWEKTYDTLGRVDSETRFDYLPAAPGSDNADEQVIALTSRYRYDAWGHRCEEQKTDGVKLVTLFSPFGADGNHIEQWQESRDQPGIRQNHRVVEYNRFDKPVYEYSLHLPVDAEAGAKPVEVDRTDYLYDGLGQAVKETLSFAPEHNIKPRVTEYRYDAWKRHFETVRPNGSVLTRTFDERSTAELTTLLEIRAHSGAAPRPVCKRSFDGLERLTSVTVGPRVETYQYRGQTDLVDTRTFSNTDPAHKDKPKQVERYDYKPALTPEPTLISTTLEDAQGPQAANEATFAYRPSSAEVVSAGNEQGARVYAYTDQGYLAREEWNGTDAQQYTIDNRHSLQGRLLYRKHSDGDACLYEHDPLARLTSVTQGHLQAVLAYDSMGRLHTLTTRDTRDPENRYVRTTQTYDDLGREHRRTLQTPDQTQMLELQWLDGTTLKSRTLYNLTDADEHECLRQEMFEYDALNRLVIQDYLGDWDEEDETSERWQALPRNAKGRAICAKTYAFDAMDNLERCLTRFADGSEDTAKFSYANDDSFQLTKVTHTLLEDYPATQAFTYDLRGNRLNDEQGRPLEYDLRGRLERVREKDGSERVHYLYDGHDQLLASVHGDGARKVQRRYQDHRLEATREGSLLTQYLLGDTHALAVQRSDAPTDPLLLLTDNAGSIVTEVDAEGTRPASYTAYGERQDDNGMHCLLAFNGELREEATGCYLLGSGYRAYTPEHGFNSPDSMPPEEVGINPYLYALGNPIKWGDPTGHKAQPLADSGVAEYEDDEPAISSNAKRILAGVFGIILLVSVISVIAAPSSMVVSPLAWAGMGVQAIGLGAQVAGQLLEKKDPKLSDILTVTGVVLGVLGAAMTIFGISTAPRPIIAQRAAESDWTRILFGRSYATQRTMNQASANPVNYSPTQSRISNSPHAHTAEQKTHSVALPNDLTTQSSRSSSPSSNSSDSQGGDQYMTQFGHVNKPTVRP
ncbi:RHS repeat-associated core domain-containing protein [Pseudomonas putida]|nr:RHS repeat-associated core domain-containing protein [Pseudomonas putida]